MTQVIVNNIVFMMALFAFLNYDFQKMYDLDKKFFFFFVVLNSFLLLATGWELLKLFL